MIDQTFECKTDIIFHPLPLKGPVGITAPPPGLLSRAIGRIGAWFWAAEEAMLPPQQYQRLYIAFDHATGAFNRATDALLHLEEQDRHCQIHDSAAGATWGLIEVCGCQTLSILVCADHNVASSGFRFADRLSQYS